MTRETLSNYKHIKKGLEEIRRILKTLDEELYVASLGTHGGDDMPKGARSEARNPADSIIDKQASVRAVYETKARKLRDALIEIERAIDKLRPREQRLIRLHYVEGLKLEDVADEMGYSTRHIRRIHEIALEQLESM